MPFNLSPSPGDQTTDELTRGLPSTGTTLAPEKEMGPNWDVSALGNLDFWTDIARQTVPGKAIADIQAARGAAYNPLTAGTAIPDPETAIPLRHQWQAAKYAGLNTAEEIQYRTNQLDQEHEALEHGAGSKWGPVASLAAGLVDPVAALSMMIPIAGASRAANALRMATVGAGVSAADEALMRELSPPDEMSWQGSALNIGAGALVGGGFGALIRGRISRAEFERMKANLSEDLNAEPGHPPTIPPGDTAADIARDLRAAAEEHGAGLEEAAQGHAAATEGIDPAEVEKRIRDAEERLSAVEPPMEDEAKAQATQAEYERLQQGEGVKERLSAHYGDELPQVLQERAESTVSQAEAAKESERSAAQAELEAARADQAKLEAAQGSAEELKVFHGEQPAAAGGESEPGVIPKQAHDVPESGPAAGATAPVKVEANILEQLKQTGRYKDADAKAQAKLVSAFYETLGKRYGTTGEEMYRRHPLKVTGAAQASGLQQALDHVFYSAAIRHVETIPQGKATGSQWLKTLENAAAKGVKPEELDWMGVKDWLAKQGEKPVTREQLLEFMHEHEVRLEEVTHGERGRLGYEPIVNRLEEMGYAVRESETGGRPELEDQEGNEVHPDMLDPQARDLWDQLANAEQESHDTKFEQYTLPGGENYKEHLLTLPQGAAVDRDAILQQERAVERYRQEVNHHGQILEGMSPLVHNADRTFFNHLQGISQLDRANAGLWISGAGAGDKEDYAKLMRLMDKFPTADAHARHQDFAAALEANRQYMNVVRISENYGRLLRAGREQLEQLRQGGVTRVQTHWAEPDVLAHVRTNERIDAEGRRVLHLEEIQSDWHQKGRAGGYNEKGAEIAARLREINSRQGEITTESNKLAADRDPVTNMIREEKRWHELRNEFETLARERHALETHQRSSVPNAPFKKSWPELALKRMIRYAAENGFDRITWTTGRQQAERYNLAKFIKGIQTVKNANPFRGAAGEAVEPQYHLRAYDKTGRDVIHQAFSESELEGVVGKEMAERIIERSKENPEQHFQGLDLQTGGEGMKGFYDQMLPSIANKLAKKYGGKVGETKIGTGHEPAAKPMSEGERTELADLQAREQAGTLNDMQRETLQTLREWEAQAAKSGAPKDLAAVHSLDIPPAMKEAALGGQPLFQDRGRGSYSPDSRTIGLSENANLSTFLHEAAHHFLDLTAELARQADAPLEMRQDMATLLKWFGVKDLEEWHSLGLEGQRGAHESFAQGFEKYLRDGVAPSTRLAGIFAKFRSWLTSIYQETRRTLEQFGRAPTDEVKGVMDRMLATEEEVQAAREARIAKAPNPTMRRIAGDDTLRQQLIGMAHDEAGWDQIGGRMIRKEVNEGGRGNEYEISRTEWIPRAEWWPGRPGDYNEAQVRHIVDKALAGEKLGDKQARLIEYMKDVADERTATEPYLPHPEHLTAAGLEPTVDNTYEVGMVTRLAAIDQEGVENLARQFEDDDAGFMAAVKRQLDAHDTDAQIAQSIPAEPEPHGLVGDGRAAAGAPIEEGARGQPGSASGEAGREPSRAAAAGERRPATGERRPATASERPRDLFGEAPTAAQRLADETRKRDAARNSGQISLETGNPGDLFSQARQQTDLTDLLQKLPADKRAPFEARIAALEHPGSAPLISAPGDSTVGAAAGDARALEMHDLSLARGGRVLGYLTGWFAPGSRALRSPSLTYRRAIMRLLDVPEMLNRNVPSERHPFGVPNPQTVQQKLGIWQGTWMEAYRSRDKLFREYRARPDPTGDPKLSKREFNEAVGQAMRRGDKWFIPEVQEAAAETRRLVFDPLKKIAQHLGLLPMQEDMLRGTAESYLLRQYDRAKIKADMLGWGQLLRDGFRAQGMDAEAIDGAVHSVTRNIMGSELGLLDINESMFANVPQSGRLKSRELLLPDELLEKYLQSDIDTLSSAYLKTLAPQVEIMRAFPGDDRNLQGVMRDMADEYNVMRQRAEAAGDTETMNKLDQRFARDGRDLQAIRDKLYGIFAVPSDPTSWAVRAGRVIRSVNVLRLLGMANTSHIPDMANIVMRRGLVNTIGASLKLATSLDALKLTRSEVQRMGTAADMIHNTLAVTGNGAESDSSFAVQHALSRAARAYTIATLETPWIAGTKAMGAMMAHDEVLEAAERVGRGEALSYHERIRLNQMGLGQIELKRIAQEFQTHGKTVNGLRFGMTDKWEDLGAAQALEGATFTAGEAATLSPGAGDTPLWTSSELGKALFQFKTFGAVAVRKVMVPLAQGLAHGDARSLSGLASMIAAGALVYTLKSKLSGQPLETNPARYSLEVLDKSNLLGWMGEYFYPALWQAGSSNFSRWGDRQTAETLLGPVLGTAADAFDLRLPAKLRGEFGSYDPQADHFTRRDVHRIRRLLPFNQYWPARRLVNQLEEHVGTSMGLPPQAPRGSTQ